MPKKIHQNKKIAIKIIIKLMQINYKNKLNLLMNKKNLKFIKY